MEDLLNNLPYLFGPEDLEKGHGKKNGHSAEAVYYVNCPFAKEMKKRQKSTGLYRRFHITAILTLLDTFTKRLQAGWGGLGDEQANSRPPAII